MGVLAVGLLFAASLWSASVRADKPLRVVASFSVLADLVRQVGGADVAVTSLVPLGGEPHDWEPGPRDVAAMAGADLVVVNGLGLEGWLDRLIAASGFAGPVLAAGGGIDPLLDASGTPDPHAWHSPAATASYARAIVGAMTQLSPARAASFDANLDRFLVELEALGAWARIEVAAIPAEGRVVVTTHDAFAWLGRDYDIRFLSPAGLDSAAQPSAKRLAELVSEIRAAGVGAVFLEAGGDARLARTLADEAGVAVGPPLYAGTLSPADGPAADYLSMWRYNLTRMLKAMPR